MLMVFTANATVNAHPIPTHNSGTSLTQSTTAASIAPKVANPKATPSIDTVDHAAKVG